MKNPLRYQLSEYDCGPIQPMRVKGEWVAALTVLSAKRQAPDICQEPGLF